MHMNIFIHDEFKYLVFGISFQRHWSSNKVRESNMNLFVTFPRKNPQMDRICPLSYHRGYTTGWTERKLGLYQKNNKKRSDM